MFLSLEKLCEIQAVPATLLLEPAARNTAPAITLAALEASESGQTPFFDVTSVNQTVQNDVTFAAALQQSIRSASTAGIVILAIAHDKPATG